MYTYDLAQKLCEELTNRRIKGLSHLDYDNQLGTIFVNYARYSCVWAPVSYMAYGVIRKALVDQACFLEGSASVYFSEFKLSTPTELSDSYLIYSLLKNR